MGHKRPGSVGLLLDLATLKPKMGRCPADFTVSELLQDCHDICYGLRLDRLEKGQDLAVGAVLLCICARKDPSGEASTGRMCG